MNPLATPEIRPTTPAGAHGRAEPAAAARHDLVVIGGGLVGSALALAAQAAGLDVALVEPQPPTPFSADATAWDSRIYAISPGNAAFLAGLGVWSRLDATRVQPVEAMAIQGDAPPGRLDFSAYDAGLPELAFIVESGALLRAMQAQMAALPGVHRYCPAQAAGLCTDAAGATVTLSDGRSLSAQLVVGTDGRESWVRQAAGIAMHGNDYAQLGVVANFSVTQAHRGSAFQWFRPDGVLALLPLPGLRVSMVWSTAEAQARELLALDAAALADAVTAASGNVLGPLQVITPAAAFPLRHARVERLIAPRVALAGDAAHHVHPLAGQGVNLGFRDVRELVAVLAARPPLQDCGEWALLRRYERARREDIAATAQSADLLQKLFALRQVWISGARNIGLDLVNRLPALKTRLIRHAVA